MWFIDWLIGWRDRILFTLHLRSNFFQPTLRTCWYHRKVRDW